MDTGAREINARAEVYLEMKKKLGTKLGWAKCCRCGGDINLSTQDYTCGYDKCDDCCAKECMHRPHANTYLSDASQKAMIVLNSAFSKMMRN